MKFALALLPDTCGVYYFRVPHQPVLDVSVSWQNEAGPRYLGINSGYIPPAALPQGLLSPS